MKNRCMFFPMLLLVCTGLFAQKVSLDQFVLVKGGTFTMGSPASEPERSSNEGPQHQVTVGSFYMSKYEVTQKEYQEMMGTNPSNLKGNKLPVVMVSWYDAIEYCNARSRKEGLTPVYTIDKSRTDPNNQSEYDTVRWVVTWNRNANGYRLPTEAEWEYAAKQYKNNLQNRILRIKKTFSYSEKSEEKRKEYLEQTAQIPIEK